MSIVDGNWKMFMARATVLSGMLGVVVFGAVKLASARDGVPGSARTWITFAGVVSGLPGDPRTANMRFSFHRSGAGADAGAPPSLCAPTVRDVSVSTTGAFSAQIPLDDSSSPCPSDMFDGRDVQVDVDINGELVARNASINPVPYAHFATIAGQYGTPDCPVGYERNTTETAFTGDMRLCQRKRTDGTVYDEVVRVGWGATAFWIDRYEATVWADSQAIGCRYGSDHTDARCSGYGTFPANGEWYPTYSGGRATQVYYTYSKAAHRPSTDLTWFMAREFCRFSGKRLPTGEEWTTAAQGTIDPMSSSSGGDGSCVTMATGPRNTGGGSRCRSAWGAEDMIGNVSEWTAEWYAGAGSALDVPSRTIGTAGEVPAIAPQYIRGVDNWPSGYNGDGTVNVATFVDRRGGPVIGIPAAANRGGSYVEGARAGIFSLALASAPSDYGTAVGFRCVIPR